MFDFLKRNKEQETLFFHTDMHSHVVPGVDDGSKKLETSIYLVKQLHNMGVNKMIATPHVNATYKNTPRTLEDPFNQLYDALKAEDLDLELSHSAEYRLDDFFEDEVMGKNEYMLFPDNYILIENSFWQQAMNFDQIVFDLKMQGYKPILAHPERYSFYAQHKEVYNRLHDYEILFQLNILSFSGYYGKEVKETAFWLLKNDLVDFIGTDMHNRDHAEHIRKFIGTSDYKKLKKNAHVKNDIIFGR